MPSARDVAYYLFHIQELHAIIQWKTGHHAVHRRDESKESRDLTECYRLLELSSRSFVAVIKELHPELLVPVVVFYLVLRALDTVEDDMTIDIDEKEELLRKFFTHIDNGDWTYNGNGPNEKDRDVLLKFDCVAREFNKFKEEYRTIIKDITRRMGNGMADYVRKADENANSGSVDTVKDYELYCHYVAGLVGEGLTRLFVEADLADPALLRKPKLMESMAQLLQQTNIIRDIREDKEAKRCFWPKEVWSKYVNEFSDLFLPGNREKALQCSSEMVLMALERADDCLTYMAGVKEQSIFNFVAIPQSMAIATLELCFQNPAIFDRNVKITKGAACQLMTESTQQWNLVCEVFRRYAKKIQERNKPDDPHFLDISIVCGNIERYIDIGYTSKAQPAIASAENVKRGPHGVEARKDVTFLRLAIYVMFGVVLAMMMRNMFRA